MTITKLLVSAPWLHGHLRQVKVLDCSWHLPMVKRSAPSEFTKAHIPTAQFFDIDEIKDLARADLPHMLPPAEFFATAMDRFGIASNDHVVVYDSAGVGPACRVFWTFHTMGHNRVSVLNGGLPAWIAHGYETEAGACSSSVTGADKATEAAHQSKGGNNESARLPLYCAQPQPDLVCSYADIVGNIEQLKASSGHSGRQIIDARPNPRFTGQAPEIRPGLSSGHMPHAISVPSSEVVTVTTASEATGEDSKTEAQSKMPPASDAAAVQVLKSPEQIRATFEAAGVDLDRPITTTCGSGVTAAVLYFALLNAGVPRENLTLFDGSWTEYALNPSSEIVKGA
ncbi:hypothetical protein GGF40_002339 [Coemansia sp. RSA 1286]|nr:hypothetical protein GGF40_002339 [Coemansia sp. RSA 1286]